MASSSPPAAPTPNRGARKCARRRTPWAEAMDREAELLLCLARVELDDAGRHRARALARQDIDWTRFLALAARHGLAPLMHRHLCDSAHAPRAALAALWAPH